MSEHLSSEQMLAYIDGESDRKEKRRVGQHLHSCWACLAEMEHMKVDIATILDAQHKVFEPVLPAPPQPWPGFGTVIAKSLPMQPISYWVRLAIWLRRLLRPAYLTVATALALFVFFFLHPHTVSAKEVLQRMYAADTRRNTVEKDQVIRQRIRVLKVSHGRVNTKSDQMEAWKSQASSYWDIAEKDSAAVDLQVEFQKHNIVQGLPLSAASVDSWGKAAGGSPTVSQRGSEVSLSYTGLSIEGDDSVERVNVTVQQATWQVKQMTLDFRDASFEVVEDDYSVMRDSEVPSNLVAYLEPYVVPVSHALPAGRIISDATESMIHLPTVNLDKAELDVFTTLHALKADLGEPVTVTRSSQAVLVGIWQLPEERQAELRAALSGKTNIQIEFFAPHILPRRVPIVFPVTSTANDAPQIQVVSGDEDQTLMKYFGGPQKEQEFTNGMLGTSTVILSHLYALRNLQEQFPAARNPSLASEEQLQLRALVRDHVSVIAENMALLDGKLAPVDQKFGVASCTTPALEESNWQGGSVHALDAAKEMDHLLRTLLTTNETPADPDVALPRIAQNVCLMRAELATLGSPDIH
jgi:hypothetical protein